MVGSALLVLLLWLSQTTLAEIYGNFTFPTKSGSSIELGTNITITWELDNPKANINLWMSQYGHDDTPKRIVKRYRGKSYEWKVSTDLNQDILLNPNFHFHMVDADGTTKEQLSGGIWSMGFALVNNDPLHNSSMTGKEPSPSNTITDSISNTATGSISNTATDGKPTSSVNSGLPPSTVAGIVVGIIVPLIFAIGFAGFWVWWQRKKIYYQAQAQAQAQQQFGVPSSTQDGMQSIYIDGSSPWTTSGYPFLPHYAMPAELLGRQNPAEMDGLDGQLPVEAGDGVPLTSSTSSPP